MLTEAEQRELDELELMELEALEAGYLQEDSEPAVIAPTEEPETSFFENTLMGAGERVGDLVGNIGGAVDDASAALRDKMGGDFRVGYNLRGEDSGFDAGWFEADEVEKQGRIGKLVEDVMTNADLGYESRYNVDKLLESEGFGETLENTFGTILEQGIVSAPDMAALIISSPTYLLSRSQELSNERATNNGRDEPTTEDRMIGSSGAVASILIDKLGLGVLQAKNLTGSFAKNLAKKIGAEATTEAIQEDIEYAATNLGTETGATLKEAGKAALGGALGGAGIGGAFGAVTETGAAIERSNARKADIARKEVEAKAKMDEANAANAEALQLSKGMETEANDIALARRQEEQLAKTKAESDRLISNQAAADATLQRDIGLDVFQEFEAEENRDKSLPIQMPIMETANSPSPRSGAQYLGAEQKSRPSRKTTQQAEESFTSPKDIPTPIYKEGDPRRKVEDAKLLVDEVETKATVEKQTSRKAKATSKVTKAVKEAQDNPDSIEAKEKANDAIATLQEVENTINVENAKLAEKQIKDEVARNEEAIAYKLEEITKAPPTNIKKLHRDEVKDIADALGIPTEVDGKLVAVGKLRTAVNEGLVPLREAAGKPDRASPVKTLEPEEMTDAEVAVEAAFKPIAKEDTVEAPVEATAPITKPTPTPTITEEKVEEKAKGKFEGWTEEDGTVFDGEGEIVEGARRKAFMKSIGIKDTEALDKKDRERSEVEKARTDYNRARDKFETLEGKPTYVEEQQFQKVKDRLDRAIQDEKDAIQIATMESMIKTNEALVNRLEGVDEGVAGQQDVEIGNLEDRVDELEGADIEAVTVEEVEPKLEKEERTKLNLDKLEAMSEAEIDVIIDGNHVLYEVTDEVAQKYEDKQAVEELSQTEGVQTIKDKYDALPKATRNKIERGYVNVFGMGPETVWAIENPDKLDAVAALTKEYKDGGMTGVDAFMKAVNESMTAPEMALPSFVTDTSEVATKDMPKAPRTTKTRILEVWKDRWGSRFQSKIVVVDSFTDLPAIEQKRKADSTAMAWAVRDGKIFVVADRVPEGYEEGLILHELGVHQLLKSSKSYEDAVTNMERMLAEGNPEVVQAYKIAKSTNKDGSKELIQEEAIAYLMSHNNSGSAFRTMANTLKAMVKKVLGLNMSTEDIIILVNSMVHKTAISEIKAEVDNISMAEEVRRMEEEGEVEEIDITATTPEMAEAADLGYGILSKGKKTNTQPSNIDEDGNYQGRVTSTPDELLDRVKNKSSANWYNVTELLKKGLAYVVSDPYLHENMERKFGLDTAGQLHQLGQDELAKAQVRTSADMKELVEPANKLGRVRGEAIVNIAHMSQIRGKDMKGSQQYNKLDSEQRAVYDRWAEQGKQQQADYIRVFKNMLEQEATTTAQKKDLNELINKFESNEDYFPFQRQGDYRLIAKMENGEWYVSRSTNRADLLKEAEKAKELGWDEVNVSREENRASDAQYIMSPSDLEMGKRIIDEQIPDGGADADAAKVALWSIMTEMARPTNLKKRTSKRLFVAGASKNLTANTLTSTGFHNEIMKLQYAPERARVVQNIVKSQKAMPASTAEEAKKKLDAEISVKEVLAREKQWNAGGTRAGWSKRASQASYILHLALSGGTALINTTQPHIVGIPYFISQGYSPMASAKAVLKAQKDVRLGFRTEESLAAAVSHYDKTISVRTGEEMLYYNQDEANMLKKAALRLANTEAGMMTDMNEVTSNADYGVKRFVNKTLGILQHRTEVGNRQATALAAYRLAIDAGKGHEQSTDEAIDSINKVNFDFSESGKSRWQKGNIGSVLSNFKSHPIKMAEVQARAFKKIVGSWEATPEEREQAIVMFSGMQIMNFAYAGMVGVPMVGAIGALYQILGDDDDDLEEWMDKSLKSVGVSDEISFGVRRGVIPAILGIDISERVGLGGSLFRMPRDASSATEWVKAIANTGGPITSRLGKIPDAAKMMDEGNYGDAFDALLTPVFAKNARKAKDWYSEGKVYDRFDNTILGEFDEMDALKQSIGLSPMYKREASREFYAAKGKESKQKRRRYRLLREVSYAVVRGSASEKRKARTAIREWNRSNRDDKITQSSIKRSIRQFREDWR